VEVARILAQHLVVVGQREELIPVFDPLGVGFGQRSYKLVVTIKPIVHAVMSNERLLSLRYRIHDKTEAHLIYIDVFFALLRLNLFLCLFLALSFTADWRPAKLLTTHHMQTQIWLLLLSVFSLVNHDAVSTIFKTQFLSHTGCHFEQVSNPILITAFLGRSQRLKLGIVLGQNDKMRLSHGIMRFNKRKARLILMEYSNSSNLPAKNLIVE